jgi:ABC-type Zn uptake system ZnuABC Zn-binding protein ZnuA
VIAEFAREVGGDAIDVTALIPPGVDVHSFEPPTQVAASVVEADLVLVNGYSLEEGLLSIVVENVRAGVPVVAASAGLEARTTTDTDQPSSLVSSDGDVDPLTFAVGDPHFWLSVPNAIGYVERIRDALVATDEANAEGYRERASALIARLEALDGEIRAQLASVPEARRQIVVFHDAFEYFAAEYGFEIAASLAPGNPNQQPSARDVASVVEVVRALDVGAVYREPQFSSPLIEAVASETGARVLTLASLPGPGAETYEAMMRADAQALVDGLGGSGG